MVVYFSIIFLLILHLFPNAITAQCVNPINSFPYNENFEATNGNWLRSSTQHWDWGAIVPGGKSVITAAGGGQKCWIIGGFSGANYSSGTSNLKSPCFDFTSLVNPEITFKVIWETEHTYDGVNLEYSIDQGNTWTILGAQNSNANCAGVNWYNSGSVRFLNYTPAWSGSILPGSTGNCQSGSGSGQWLTARHKLNMLAGLNKVIFRFSFGAGTVCNDYEGFAIDDICIKEIAANGADFNYNCIGNNAVNFINNSSYCQTAISWNFGDLISGTSNTSTLDNPSHTFSAPGSYLVTQTVTFSNIPVSVKTATINILGVTPAITQSLLCNGDQNGTITANATGGTGLYNYSWDTNPIQQTSSISGLSADTYTVNVSATDACPASASVTLVEPSQIIIDHTIVDATCNLNNGSIQTVVNGGTASYIYLWSNGESTVSITDLNAGTYNLLVTDANNCSANTGMLTINNNIIPAHIDLGGDTTICPGQTILLQPGNFANYLWQDNSNAPTFLVTQTGAYSVEVTNTAGCKTIGAINVIVDCKGVYFPSSFTPNGDHLNDEFGPVGDVGGMREFSMFIYNRWGQLVFSTTNPFEKWNGKYNSKVFALETFVWMASYKYMGEKFPYKKGFVTIIR